MKITLIGVGLIGGSIALKLKANRTASYIYGVDLNNAHLQTAKELEIIDEISSLENAVRNSDLIILAIPVDAAKVLIGKILNLIKPNQTVMDAGSTKSGIVEAIKNHPNRNCFVAFHPMWGTENSGPEAAVSDSFSGRAAVICDRENSAEDAIKTAENVARSLGMHLIYMSARDHDLHTAYISHISHITSYALANTVLEKEQEEETIFQLASTGFSSTVRLAKSHPEMWVPIFKQNRENVLDVLNEHITQLNKFREALENKDFVMLGELIINANKIRGILEK